MGYKNREKEMKFTLKREDNRNVSYGVCKEIFDDIFRGSQTHYGESTDLYWHIPKLLKAKADFIRLRSFGGHHGEITTKGKDRGSNTDRIEIDLDIDDLGQAHELIGSFLGKPNGKVTKKYAVYATEPNDLFGSVSIYQVSSSKNIYIEVESTSLSKVNKNIKDLIGQLKYYGLELHHEPRSLYEIFIKKAKI